MHHRLCVVMHHHLNVIGKHRHIPLPCLKVLSSQVHEGCVVACAMTRRLGPIFNAANDAVAQALSTTRRAELVRGGGYISPKCSRHGHVPSQGVTTMGRRANKHILLTGGNSGIGLAAAQEFDREGARVAVKLDHVTRTYRRDAFEVRALDDVSLTIPTQGFVAIMGPSGSGKTTLLNLVAGIDHVTSGSVVVGEEEITTMNERELAAWRARHIGLVFQFYNLIPVLTAFENVELPLLLTHLSKAERKTHVASALKAVGLADRMEHYPRQLSGGQEQRVAIARAIVTDPTILVADEPTGDLDAKSAEEILILLTQLKTQFDKTIVMVTHDPRSERFVDTVYRLDKGVFTGAEKGGASTKATASLQISA